MHQNSSIPRDSIKEMLVHIQTLREEGDQSREEACGPIIMDGDVSIQFLQQRKVSGASRKSNDTMGLGEFCRKQTKSHWETKKEDQQVNDLQVLNQKLFNDNKALLKECIRLKKLVSLEGGSNPLHSDRIYELEVQNLNLLNELNKLKTENLRIKGELLSRTPSGQTQPKNMNLSAFKQIIDRIEQDNEKLQKKIECLELKEKNQKISGVNSTLESKCSDWDRDRVITNLKVVYENKIKMLEEKIKNQTVSSMMSEGVTSPRRRNESPRSTCPTSNGNGWLKKTN